YGETIFHEMKICFISLCCHVWILWGMRRVMRERGKQRIYCMRMRKTTRNHHTVGIVLLFTFSLFLMYRTSMAPSAKIHSNSWSPTLFDTGCFLHVTKNLFFIFSVGEF